MRTDCNGASCRAFSKLSPPIQFGIRLMAPIGRASHSTKCFKVMILWPTSCGRRDGSSRWLSRPAQELPVHGLVGRASRWPLGRTRAQSSHGARRMRGAHLPPVNVARPRSSPQWRLPQNPGWLRGTGDYPRDRRGRDGKPESLRPRRAHGRRRQRTDGSTTPAGCFRLPSVCAPARFFGGTGIAMGEAWRYRHNQFKNPSMAGSIGIHHCIVLSPAIEIST